jgi:hypothetical protein
MRSPKKSLLEAALSYATLGWRVFPCEKDGKRPLTKNGYKDAPTDQIVIGNWWPKADSGANIGVAWSLRALLGVEP